VGLIGARGYASAVREWSAEVVVDESLARRLIGGQFPELELGSLLLLAEGWDNTVWVGDGRWAFRFPRRAIAIPAIERAQALLPRLAPLLPLPIPEPVLLGRPADGYPWPFFGAVLLPGREVSEVALTADPSIDLPLVWSLLPPGGRADFLDAYGPVTEEQLLRAGVLAHFLSARIALYAHDQRLQSPLREAIGSLERAVL